ncbi:MAG: thioredoxin [Candidatus Bathyarchaeota archaeon]|jgi:thioredoxin 1
MVNEDKQFISDEDEELERIKRKKMKELMRLGENKVMSDKPVQITDSDFNEIISKHPIVLVDCWAPWCGPCTAIAPIVEEIAREYSGKVFVGKLNVDQNPMTANSFQIMGIPTLLIIKEGKEVDRIVGLVPKQNIQTRLEKQL